MPPKRARLRPAAAPGAFGRGVRRRPAAAVEDRTPNLDLASTGIEDFLREDLLVFSGRYWEAEVVLAGKAVNAQVPDGTRHLQVKVGGTKSESLLKYISGRPDKLIWVHLCGDDCPTLVWKDDLVHTSKVQAWKKDPEEWMTNCKAAVGVVAEGVDDELAAMRREAEMTTGLPRSPAREKSKDRKEKEKEKKQKKKEKEKEAKKREKNAKKARGKKDLEDLFGQTGLDPDPDVRAKLMKKGKRILKNQKKKKKKSKERGKSKSSSSGSDSETKEEESETTIEADETLFEEQTTVKKVAKAVPGLLTANWIKESQRYLMTAQGLAWEAHQGEVPALATQFFRNQVAPRMGAAMSREFMTLAFAVDQALQGNICMTLDTLVQRMKALSSMSSGVHFSIAQKLELLPAEKTNPASLEETQEAARAARQEDKVFAQASKPSKPWGNSSFSWEPQGGKAKGKDGKNKKGKGKDQKGKEGQNKGGDEPKKWGEEW